MADASWLLRKVSSGTAMIEASAEFFMVATASLPIAGMAARAACGPTIRRITIQGRSPTARAASVWPRSTPSTAERRISAKNVASLAASATPAAMTGLRTMPACGSAVNTNTSWSTNGVPRKITL